MMRFLLLMINLNPGLGINDVQNILANNRQWYRIAPNVWVLYTNEPLLTWHQRMYPLVNPSGTMFIAPLDPSERQGWMPKEFWEWVKVRVDRGGRF